MSVETLYTDTDQKDATKRAVIGGIELGEIYQVTWDFSIGKVPTATISIPNPTPSFVKYFADVTIDAGFNGLTERVFTGKVMNVAANEKQTNIACAGLSQFLDRPSEDVTILIEDTTNLVVLNAIFALAGISFFEIDIPSIALGTVVTSTLQFQSFAEAVDKVAEINGGRWVELPSGLIRVIVADPIAQASANRTYFTMNLTALVESRPAGLLTGRPRIRTIRKSHDVAKVKNRIHVRGATITTTQPDGSSLSTDIERTVSGPSEFVLEQDGSQAFNDLLFANDLIDNNALADAVVTRLLAVNNRLLTVLNLMVDGDPLRRLAESVRVEDESYPITTGRFFVERYRTLMGQSDFSTALTVVGEGTSSEEDPVAQTVFCQMLSIIIDDRRYTVVTFDARGSFSPSGVAITTFAWSDNQSPQVATGSDSVITVRIDPTTVSPEPWTITLTITDANGNSDSVVLTVDPTECQEDCVNIATLFSALETDSSASADGGATWNDDSINSISAAAHPSISGLAVYGTIIGQFYRTTDYAVSLTLVQTAGSGSPVRDITWDPDNHSVVWAVLDNAEVWQSVDAGLTWAQYSNLRVSLEIAGACAHRIKIVGGTALVFGGVGDGEPLIAVDVNKSNSWSQAVIGGDLRTDLDSTSHANSLYIADGAVDELWRLAIILNDPTFEPSVYYTTDLFGDGTQWNRATGLPGGKSLGSWLDRDLEDGRFVFQYDDTVIYLGDVAGGIIATTTAAAALDGGDVANHGFWLGRKVPGLGAVYIIDGEGAVDGTIYISWDRFANIGKVRPATGFPVAPAGANARMTDLGTPALCPELFIQGEREGFFQETAQLNGTTWIEQSTDLGLPDWHIISLNGVLYRIANADTTSTIGGGGDLERSTDLGVTWTIVIGQNVFDQWGIVSIAIGPDGVLWAGSRTIFNASTPIRIYKSTDNGVTWVRILTGFEDGTQHRTIDIAIDPFNANNIVISCERFNGIEVVLVSTDGGVSWVSRAGPPGFNSDFGFWVAFGDSGRLLAATNQGIFTSDDLGVTWVQRDTVVAFASAFLIRGPSVDQFIYAHENGAPAWFLRRSLNNGQTWEELATETDLYPAAGSPLWSGTFMQDGGLVICTRPNAGASGINTIWRQANPFAAVVPAFSSWENWTYNWGISIGGGNIGLQGIASILRDGH